MGIYNPSSATSSGRLAIRSVTSATTATTSDNVIQASGGSFTITLPSAASSLGLELILKKTDASLTNIITVTAAGTDTIDAAATTTLNTQYEQVSIVSDGVSNWSLVSRTYPQNWISYTPTFVGLGTVSNIGISYQRVGSSINIRGNFMVGTTTAVTATMSLPSGLTTSTIPFPVYVGGYGWRAAADAASVYNGILDSNVTTVFFGVQSSTTNWSTKQLGNNLFTTGTIYSFFYTIPIAGWN